MSIIHLQAFRWRCKDAVVRPVRLFVYGTLMRGFELHRECFADAPLTIERGVIAGTLIHLPEGYPALLEGEGWVHGELITLSPKWAEKLWPTLDEAESFIRAGHPSNLYERVKRPVVRRDRTRVQAWTYVYSDPKDALSRGVVVPGGDWRRFIRG